VRGVALAEVSKTISCIRFAFKFSETRYSTARRGQYLLTTHTSWLSLGQRHRDLVIFVSCGMGSKKRNLEDATSPKAKKSKVAIAEGSTDKKEKKAKPKADKPLQYTSNLVPEEIDFPRGGGTTYTPQEVKAIRAEAVKEAEEELFKVQMQYLVVMPQRLPSFEGGRAEEATEKVGRQG
jgi:lipoprotein-anchoring transpeptidase ErfK/SrfK